MKILIDASNIKIGGGLQAAISFITYVYYRSREDGVEFYYLLSEQVFKQLPFDLKGSTLLVSTTDFFCLSPISNKKIKIMKFVGSINPDVVYTVFGPSFLYYNYKHVVGFANAWIVSPDTIAYRQFGFFKRKLVLIKNKILSHLIFNGSKYYFTETEDIKNKMFERASISKEKISVIPNSLPYMYSCEERFIPDMDSLFSSQSINLITVASNYPHKNLRVIPKVAKILEKKGYNVKFYTTIPFEQYEAMSDEFKKYTSNLGEISVEQCASLYCYADIMFLPTLLECFSVSYLEAMYFSTPICTSDFPFSREVCKDAAVYFNPKDEVDIASKIERLIIDPEYYEYQKGRCKEVIKIHLFNEERSERQVKELIRIGNNV